MAPEDERKSIWAAVGLNSDRITALEAIVKDRDESMREMIREAVPMDTTGTLNVSGCYLIET